MNIAESHQELIDSLTQGDFVGPMERFYAEDVVMQTNNGKPSRGRDALVAAETEYVKGVRNFHGVDVLATAVDDEGAGNGTVFYEVEMRWEHVNNPKVDIRQSVVERWKDGKISEIRFYGDIEL